MSAKSKHHHLTPGLVTSEILDHTCIKKIFLSIHTLIMYAFSLMNNLVSRYCAYYNIEMGSFKEKL